MIGVVRTRQLACKEQVQALLDLNRTEEQSEDRTDHKNLLNDTEFQTPQERCLHSTLEKPCDDDRTSEYEVSVIQWEKIGRRLLTTEPEQNHGEIVPEHVTIF